MIPTTTLFLDLETLPGDATVGMDLDHAPGWDPPMPTVEPKTVPRNWKDAEKIAEWNRLEIVRQTAAVLVALEKVQAADLKHWRDGSMRPVDGRIACIGWALGENPPEVIDCAEDEVAGLMELLSLMSDARPTRIVAHNGAGFDFPWIQLRAGRWGLRKLPHLFYQEKPWEERLWDTLVRWPGQRMKGGSLDNCAKLLGISREANPISGGQVLDAYVESRWTDVADHCLDDIAVLREVYRWELEVVHG